MRGSRSALVLVALLLGGSACRAERWLVPNVAGVERVSAVRLGRTPPGAADLAEALAAVLGPGLSGGAQWVELAAAGSTTQLPPRLDAAVLDRASQTQADAVLFVAVTDADHSSCHLVWGLYTPRGDLARQGEVKGPLVEINRLVLQCGRAAYWAAQQKVLPCFPVASAKGLTKGGFAVVAAADVATALSQTDSGVETNLGITVSLSRSVYHRHPGDLKPEDLAKHVPEAEMEITVHADQACYVSVWDVDVAGKMTLLFPNGYDRSNHLGQGQTVTVPPPDKSWFLPFGGAQGGQEEIVVIGTDKSFEAVAGQDGELVARSKGPVPMPFTVSTFAAWHSGTAPLEKGPTPTWRPGQELCQFTGQKVVKRVAYQYVATVP